MLTTPQGAEVPVNIYRVHRHFETQAGVRPYQMAQVERALSDVCIMCTAINICKPERTWLGDSSYSIHPHANYDRKQECWFNNNASN